MRSERGRLARGVALVLPLIAITAGSSAGTLRSTTDGSRASSLARANAPRDTVTLPRVALGDSIFHGTVAGAICATCHGTDAKGTPGMGPDLSDGEWLHGDGGLNFLATIITSGVLEPKVGGVAMPPWGGTPLTPEQLQAVAAYVWSLSHKTGG